MKNRIQSLVKIDKKRKNNPLIGGRRSNKMKNYRYLIMVLVLFMGLSSAAFGANLYVNNSTWKDANDAAELCKVGWINSAYLWTSVDVTGFDIGDIIECISGDGDDSYAILAATPTLIEGSYRCEVTVAGHISSWQTGNELNFVDLDAPAATNAFKYIKTAIGAATAADIIIIATGTYDKGPYTVSKALTFQHTADTFSPKVTTTAAGNVFTISQDITPVTFQGITMDLYTGASVGIYQTVNSGSPVTVNVRDCYFTGEVDADEAIDLNADATHAVVANLDNATASGNNWWEGCYTAVQAQAKVKSTDGGGGITVNLATINGIQGTCVFTTTDHTEKTAETGTYDVRVTLNRAPYEAETFTVSKWDCAPPGNLVKPPHTASLYTAATSVPYLADSYIHLASTDSWAAYTFEATVVIPVADASGYANALVMRYHDDSFDDSDYGWVTVPDVTVTTGASEEISFNTYELGTYCIVLPGGSVTAGSGTEMSLYVSTVYLDASTPSAAANKVIFPNNPTANTTDWPLIDPTYTANGGAANSDWDIDLTNDGTSEYSNMTWYLVPNGDDGQFCGFDIQIRWAPDQLNFSYFDPTGADGDLADDMWIGSLFKNGGDTQFNTTDYYLETRFREDGSGLRMSVFPKAYGADKDVTAADDSYICKLEFDVVAPGYSPIYIEYADLRAFAAGVAPLHKFVKPYHAAYVNYLGDVENTGTSHILGDGLVGSDDLSLWSSHYWAGIDGSYVPAASNYCYKYDVGPTRDGYVYSFPEQDTKIEFEDLMIFAMAYDLTNTTAQLIRNPESIAPMISFGAARSTNRSTVEIPILLENEVKDLRAASFKIDYNHDALRFIEARKGELLENTETLSILFANEVNDQAWCDFAVTNAAAPAINEIGELVILTFEVVGEGNYELEFCDTRLRDSRNNNMIHQTEEPEEITSYNLMQNFPNPVKNSSSINFTVPKSGNVNLSVYNILGQKVATLVNGFKEAGSYETQFNAKGMSNGIYLYRLEVDDVVKTNKMMIFR